MQRQPTSEVVSDRDSQAGSTTRTARPADPAATQPGETGRQWRPGIQGVIHRVVTISSVDLFSLVRTEISQVLEHGVSRLTHDRFIVVRH